MLQPIDSCATEVVRPRSIPILRQENTVIVDFFSDSSDSSPGSYVSFECHGLGTPKHCLIVDSVLSNSDHSTVQTSRLDEYDRLVIRSGRVQDMVKSLQQEYHLKFISFRQDIEALVTQTTTNDFKVENCFDLNEIELTLDRIKQRHNTFKIKEQILKSNFQGVDCEIRQKIYTKHQLLVNIYGRLISLCKPDNQDEKRKWTRLYKQSEDHVRLYQQTRLV